MPTVKETVTAEAPLYQVTTPNYLPNYLFHANEYDQAFQHATGRQIPDDLDDDPDGEENITILDFEGEVEVPVVTDD